MSDDGATYVMTPLDRARYRYADLAAVLLAMTGAHWPKHGRNWKPLVECGDCARADRQTDAASVALDMVTAWTFAGRHPRGQARREVPA